MLFSTENFIVWKSKLLAMRSLFPDEDFSWEITPRVPTFLRHRPRTGSQFLESGHGTEVRSAKLCLNPSVPGHKQDTTQNA